MTKRKNATTIYTVSIEFAKSPAEVFDHITDLSKWWPEDFVGESMKPGSEFVLRIGDEHYSKNKVTDFLPGKKVAWITTESIRKSDNYDWTGTKMIFELTPNGGNTLLKFTYDGTVPENEYDRLVEICNFCIKDALYNFIVNGREK